MFNRCACRRADGTKKLFDSTTKRNHVFYPVARYV